MKPIFEVSAGVHAPADAVRGLFDNDWILKTALGRMDGSTSTTEAIENYADIERTPGGFNMQGHWWYRGEWFIDDEASQTRLVHRVFNIANSYRWAVPLANKLFIGYRADLQQGIDQLAQAIDEHVGSPGH